MEGLDACAGRRARAQGAAIDARERAGRKSYL